MNLYEKKVSSLHLQSFSHFSLRPHFHWETMPAFVQPCNCVRREGGVGVGVGEYVSPLFVSSFFYTLPNEG